ncbi:hypothetical protein EE612_034541, partial [Oryza sativa]
ILRLFFHGHRLLRRCSRARRPRRRRHARWAQGPGCQFLRRPHLQAATRRSTSGRRPSSTTPTT